MAKKKSRSLNVTPMKCFNGKRHVWGFLYTTSFNGHGFRFESKWCSGCGSLTSFKVNKKFKRTRVKDKDGDPVIHIPKNLQ